MGAKGKTPEEAEKYFEHIEAINDRAQPILVIGGSPEATSIYGLAGVVYGNTAGPDDFLGVSRMGTSQGRSARFNYDEITPGTRQLDIYARNKVGFVASEFDDDPQQLIATDTKKFSRVVANIYSDEGIHPFEEVHFAGTAEEVDEIVGQISSNDNRIRTDHSAFSSLGLPTLVAYGDEAVIAVSERIGENSSTLKVLSKRCMDEAGIDVSGIEPDFSDYKLMAVGGNKLFTEFDDALRTYLSGGEGDQEALAKLALLGPYT